MVERERVSQLDYSLKKIHRASMSKGIGKTQRLVLGALAEEPEAIYNLYMVKCYLWGNPQLFHDYFGRLHRTYGGTWHEGNEHFNLKRALLGLVTRGLAERVAGYHEAFRLTSAGLEYWLNFTTHLKHPRGSCQ